MTTLQEILARKKQSTTPTFRVQIDRSSKVGEVIPIRKEVTEEKKEEKKEEKRKPSLAELLRSKQASAKREEKPIESPLGKALGLSREEMHLIREEVQKEKKKLSLKEILAAKQRNQEEASLQAEPEPTVAELPTASELLKRSTTVPVIEKALESTSISGVYREVEELYKDTDENIVLNERQQAVVDMMLAGKSLVVTGAAGTGKSTVQRRGAEILLESSSLSVSDFKIQGTDMRVTAPSIAFVAYTRRAANNLRRIIHRKPALEKELQFNIMTIHALLEYAPETYYELNPETGLTEEKFRFAPRRTAENPLTLTHLVIEEASQVDLTLFAELMDALPAGVQIIFIGDINQLPPVFGPSILNYALTKLPVIELTEVYRQAMNSPVLNNAHRILKGLPLEEQENEDGSLVIMSGKNPLSLVGQSKMSLSVGKIFRSLYEQKEYIPEEHMILSPWNKQDLGTIELNKHISQFLGEERNAVIFEIIASFHKLYLAVGDKVMYNKMDATIIKIEANPLYTGRLPRQPSPSLSRWGWRLPTASLEETSSDDSLELSYESFSVEALANETLEKKAQASHAVVIEYTDSGEKQRLTASGDFAPAIFSLGYVLTVHKAQGSEWDKVFIVLHKAHAVSLYRELLYTAVTRAKRDCILITKPFVIDQALKTQKVKGDTLEDKIAYFNQGLAEDSTVQVTK